MEDREIKNYQNKKIKSHISYIFAIILYFIILMFCLLSLTSVHTFMHVHPHSFECVNRVGVPSSIRDSQKPFLVLDRAVRMHRLVPSLSGAQGMYSFIREWKDETWEVSSSIRTDKSAQREVWLTCKHTECDSASQRSGTHCKDPVSYPLCLSR